LHQIFAGRSKRELLEQYFLNFKALKQSADEPYSGVIGSHDI
jgi:hypothetical protein